MTAIKLIINNRGLSLTRLEPSGLLSINNNQNKTLQVYSEYKNNKQFYKIIYIVFIYFETI